MAIANFFDRAAQAVSQALKTVDGQVLAAKLTGHNVGIAFDDTALDNPNTGLMLSLATNLAARIYPRISLIHDGSSPLGQEIKKELEGLALSINPYIELVEHGISFTLCLGNPNIIASNKVFINAGSWNMEVSVGKPAAAVTQVSYNPFSSAAAVCFGMDEVFRFVFSDSLPQDTSPEHYVLNLLDYSRDLSADTSLPPINFKDLNLVGLGAVGNALVWALSNLEDLTGHITLIDHETVELSNLQRYILTDQQSIDRHKTVIAEETLRRDGLEISYHPELRFGQYVAQHRPDCMFDVIAVSVDNAADRVASQAVLPRVALNAWTGDNGQLGISRHWFDSDQACLACLYLSTSQQVSELDQLVELTGMPPQRIVEMMANRTPLDPETLQEIAAGKNYPPEVIASFRGQTINEFYTKAVCGGVLMNFIDQNQPESLVPLAHQSVLAGVLLAAEVVKESIGMVSKKDPVETKIQVLGRPKEFLNQRRGKTEKPQCICQDKDYLMVYRKKFNS